MIAERPEPEGPTKTKGLIGIFRDILKSNLIIRRVELDIL